MQSFSTQTKGSKTNTRKTFPFDHNPEVKDPLLAREQFAVKLRTEKKRLLLSEKRMKLTKSKFVLDITQSGTTKLQLQNELAQMQ